MSINYKYYSLKNILSKNAQYNMIIGERSNGKTYSCLKYGLEQYVKTGKTMCVIRRWKEDFRGKRGQHLFDALIENNIISKLTKNQWDTVQYYNGQWWLALYDSETDSYIKDSRPFCFGFSLSDVEHDKSISYPTVTTVIFDEFLTRGYYLVDEFIVFMNVLSSIIRQRTDVTIFMLGNTVNKYCPYFSEMGLSHIKNQQQGTIDVYNYGSSGLKVAVEYCATNKKSKPSDIYFAFDNPSLEMIKSGVWEIGIYPHLPFKYKSTDIMFTFFIVFETVIQCEVIYKNNDLFVYCHLKTTPLQNNSTDIIYRLEASPTPNIRQGFIKAVDNIDRKILQLYKGNKFFYQNNDIGEVVNNYIKALRG